MGVGGEKGLAEMLGTEEGDAAQVVGSEEKRWVASERRTEKRDPDCTMYTLYTLTLYVIIFF